MFIMLAIVVGVLYGAAVYLMLDLSIVKLIFGLVLLSHAANLLIFVVAGLRRAQAPLVAADQTMPPADSADPLPQALVLTAIVISFAVLAFATVLVRQVVATVGTDDSEQMLEQNA